MTSATLDSVKTVGLSTRTMGQIFTLKKLLKGSWGFGCLVHVFSGSGEGLQTKYALCHNRHKKTRRWALVLMEAVELLGHCLFEDF